MRFQLVVRLIIILITIKIINPSFVKSISYLSFDLYQKIFSEQKKDSQVVIIDIDESSLGKFGQFPWSRSVFAKILDQLNLSNPKAIGFDIFFTEKDKQSPDEIMKSYGLIPSDLKDLQKLKSHDEIFSEKLKESSKSYANEAKELERLIGGELPENFDTTISDLISNFEADDKCNFPTRPQSYPASASNLVIKTSLFGKKAFPLRYT